jgi:hypothetical protein
MKTNDFLVTRLPILSALLINLEYDSFSKFSEIKAVLFENLFK